MAAFLAFAADDQDGLVFRNHFAKGSVAANELSRADVALQLFGELLATLRFGFTTAVGQKDVGPKRGQDCLLNRCVLSASRAYTLTP